MPGRKTVGVLGVLLILMLCASVGPVQAETNTGVMVNNQVIVGSEMSTNYNNILMVPAKELISSIGGTFSYDTNTMTGILKNGKNEMVLRLDNSIVMFNGKYIQAPAPLKIMGYRFMIPVEFVSRKFGAEVYYNNSKNIMMIYAPVDGKLLYKVMAGDTLWLISQRFGTSISEIKMLNGMQSDAIYIGKNLIIKNIIPNPTVIQAYTSKSATLFSGEGFNFPASGYLQAWTSISITGKSGSWYIVTTPKGSGYIFNSVVYIKQDLTDNNTDSNYFKNIIPVDTSKDFISSITYTVQSGETIWSIAQNNGVPANEVASFNNISTNAVLYIGTVLKIPVHNIPVKDKTGAEYGEILDWFKEGQYLFPIGKEGRFVDLQSGASFMARRTIGASHADVETLTASDTQNMKAIFGGNWTWNKRPFLLEVDGRKFAVSVSGMPHAGVDSMPFLQNVYNRSDDWGYGPNYDCIKGNGMDGHFDVFFLNSLRHVDNNIDSSHQASVLISGGLQ